jgi:hypothetical protein
MRMNTLTWVYSVELMNNDTRRVVAAKRWMEEALVKVGEEDMKIEMMTMIIINNYVLPTQK